MLVQYIFNVAKRTAIISYSHWKKCAFNITGIHIFITIKQNIMFCFGSTGRILQFANGCARSGLGCLLVKCYFKRVRLSFQALKNSTKDLLLSMCSALML